jgi:MoaA/NifB/PqqE/SkfB family radical SAM enzyme
MMTESNVATLVEQAVEGLFKDAFRLSFNGLAQDHFCLQTMRYQKEAAGLRLHWHAAGVPVPPVMMVSITDRCNLRCQGCLAQAHLSSPRAEMDEGKVRSIFAEARELGISIILLIGGEPLMRKEILTITRDFPGIIFLLFTNGLFMNEDLLGKFKEQQNVIPVMSLEGCEEETDGRRGKGVYRHLQGLIEQMEQKDCFWGLSFTLTRPNFHTVTDPQFIKGLVDGGCRLFFFVEYKSMDEGPGDWVLTGEQRSKVLGEIEALESRFNALFIAFPGSEERFGGCLSAGRGFVHISTDGDVEPCPFVPYSDSNLKNLSLKEALRSEFLRNLRQNRPEQTGEREGGCALRENSEWVLTLLNSKTVSIPKDNLSLCQKR